MARDVTVMIPTPLREYTDGQSEVSAGGETVGEILDELNDRFPGLKERICNDEGELREFLNIYMNDEDIRFLEELDTPVEDGDSLSIIPAIAGGGRRVVLRPAV